MTDLPAAIQIKQDLCSKCSVCYSVCPFEAIEKDSTTGNFDIDRQKCQLCGICYSACPVSAINIVYYDYNSLVKYVKNSYDKIGKDTLVLMCRGNSPSTGEIQQILKQQGLDLDGYIPLRLPCAGRVPSDFVFKVLNSGIKRVVSVQCEDDFCRYKEGTKIGNRRMALTGAVISEFGLSKDALKVVKHSRRVTYDTEKCVGCDKCVFICPFDAIKAEPFATPKIVYDSCKGCGACALVCPHEAIQIEGFEFQDVLERYGDSARKLKSNGISPLILVMACQWSEFSALDDPMNPVFTRNAAILEIPCFKALDPVHVVNALKNGFDGVMAVVCSDEDCKMHEGRDTADRNVSVLKDVLRKMGLLERFDLFTVSPRDISDFTAKLDGFSKKIAAMQPKLAAGMEAVSRTTS